MSTGANNNAFNAGTTCAINVNIHQPPKSQREYIYNLLPRASKDDTASYTRLPPIRKGRFGNLNEGKQPQKTMGPPGHDKLVTKLLPDKQPYLKKHSKQPYVKQRRGHGERRCLKADELQEATGAGDSDGVPLKCLNKDRRRVNWIVRNAVSAITAKPGHRIADAYKHPIVDQRNGNKYPLISERTVSGLEPLYVYKPQMGKLPTYIKERLRVKAASKDILKHYLNEKDLQRTDYLLTDEQREELLIGLKGAWDAFNRKYLKLASSSDTLKSKAYKQNLENQLDSLKKDIDTIENHQFIFVDAPKEAANDGDDPDNICV